MPSMKYTRYIINDAVDLRKFETDRPAFKPPVTVFMSVVAIVGFVGMSCFVPMAITMDGIRSVRYRIIKHQRKN